MFGYAYLTLNQISDNCDRQRKPVKEKEQLESIRIMVHQVLLIMFQNISLMVIIYWYQRTEQIFWQEVHQLHFLSVERRGLIIMHMF